LDRGGGIYEWAGKGSERESQNGVGCPWHVEIKKVERVFKTQKFQGGGKKGEEKDEASKGRRRSVKKKFLGPTFPVRYRGEGNQAGKSSDKEGSNNKEKRRS